MVSAPVFAESNLADGYHHGIVGSSCIGICNGHRGCHDRISCPCRCHVNHVSCIGYISCHCCVVCISCGNVIVSIFSLVAVCFWPCAFI